MARANHVRSDSVEADKALSFLGPAKEHYVIDTAQPHPSSNDHNHYVINAEHLPTAFKQNYQVTE